ncbi:MAG: hypothetical protein ThorAB25_05070 [Candidatus Thorarchaeota archaeon AB_25]|nr:MAG: hypothetical protein ThorAB25_05070 [Candidatus Thorarchaeota archaeon AB_25]
MPKLPLRYYCYVCGHTNDLKLNVPLAPKIERDEIKCANCGDVTHLLLTACPKCEGAFRYYLSDLDFPQEIVSLAEAYVKLLTGVRDSLKDHIKEFNVPVPKKWSVNLKCECGEEYTAEIPLPQLSG